MTFAVSFQTLVNDKKLRTDEEIEEVGRLRFVRLFFGKAKLLLLLRHFFYLSWPRSHDEALRLVISAGLAGDKLRAQTILNRLAIGTFTDGRYGSTIFKLEAISTREGEGGYRMTAGAPDLPGDF